MSAPTEDFEKYLKSNGFIRQEIVSIGVAKLFFEDKAPCPFGGDDKETLNYLFTLLGKVVTLLEKKEEQ